MANIAIGSINLEILQLYYTGLKTKKKEKTKKKDETKIFTETLKLRNVVITFSSMAAED